MKIYILPVHSKLQPDSQTFVYPQHNKDYGVEQDFLSFLDKSVYIVETPHQADWHYLPVFWTRWHLNHVYAKFGLPELQEEVDKVLLNDSKTFTICQYDDGPMINLGKTVQFLASRKTDQGIDIPLLCSHHRKPILRPAKKYKASFIGRLSSHPIRQEMLDVLKQRKDIYIYDGHKDEKYYVKTILRSSIALCPRGYGGSSFRFFEAMQLGVPPLLIGDIDTRPFKQWLDWDKASFFIRSANDLHHILEEFSKINFMKMGNMAKKIYKDHITYKKWCPYILEELKVLK